MKELKQVESFVNFVSIFLHFRTRHVVIYMPKKYEKKFIERFTIWVFSYKRTTYISLLYV